MIALTNWIENMAELIVARTCVEVVFECGCIYARHNDGREARSQVTPCNDHSAEDVYRAINDEAAKVKAC